MELLRFGRRKKRPESKSDGAGERYGVRDGVPKAENYLFDRGRDQEDEGEPPTRSILGLGRIEPTPFRIAAPASGTNGERPSRSLLGLEGIAVSPLRRGEPVPGTDAAPPSASLLGLQATRAAPFAWKAIAPGTEGEPPNASILGLGGIEPSSLPPIRRPARPARPAIPAEPTSPSFFGLGGLPPTGSPGTSPGEVSSRSFFGLEAMPYASTATARQLEIVESPEIEVPEFERDVEHRSEPAFPVERAVLASLLAHALLLLLLLSAPSIVHDPRKGLLAAFVPPEKTEEEKVPIIFKEAPGPARENPKKSAPSDADRRAGGGDRNRPRAESPFVPERPGKEGLAPGTPRGGAPRVPPRPAVKAQAEKGPEKPGPKAGEAVMKPEDGSFVVPKGEPSATGQAAGAKPTERLAGLQDAIKAAAEGVGARGENGAGTPNLDGGFVDEGPLSFDTSWYDWGPYAAEMIRRIKLHWEVPSLARLGWKGKLTVRFYILANGSVEGATFLSHSGVPPFDNAAMQAILTSDPFRPLPKDLLAQVPGKDREGITVTFFYNIRPGDAGGGSEN